MKSFFQNNVAYTRGALLALFAGLFILTACGNTVNINNNPAPPPTQTCADNPYGADCTVAQKKAAVDLCRTAIEDGESCATNTPAAVVSCLTDPFGADCTSAEDTAGIVKDLINDKVIVIKDEQTRVLPTVQDDCEATPTQGSCPSVLSAIKEACDANPFDMLCTADTDYDDARRDACLGAAKDTILSESCRTNTLAEGVCEANPFAHTGCENLTAIGGYRTTYCTTGTTTVFETTCGAFNGSEIVAGTNDARRDACLGAAKDTILSESCKTNTLAEGVCEANPFAHTGCENLTANPGYRTTYCTTNTATIFESDCGDADLYGATNAARGEACLAGYAGEGSNNCGDEDMAGTYIKAYCATDAGNTDITNCPKKYAGANPDVDTVIAGGLTGKALNATGTGLERVVASGEANTANDDRANFIVGDTDALNLGSVTTTRASTLKLGTLANSSDTNSGFAIAVGEFDTVNHRFYVGLLSGTALGAPLDNPTQGGIWNAKINLLTSVANTPLLEADFKLNVDFATKSLKIVNAAGANANINFDIGNASFAFNIDGKFTANGVIYGRVALGGSKGTLTGLIGSSGAVGIFNGGVSPYVGGFVAAKTDCTVTPFDAYCTDYDKQAILCNAHDTTSVTEVGGDFDTDCTGNAEVANRVCTIYGNYANLFNRALCPDAAGNSVKRARFCARYIYPYHAFGVFRPTGFDVHTDCAGDPAVTALVCRASGQYAEPFDVNLCPDSDALRVELCSHPRARENLGSDFDNCLNNGITDLICIASGPYANPFNTNICPDSKSSNKEARVTACRDRTLPDGVNVLIDCARDSAITDVICATSGANANPFDRDICTSNEMTTIGEGDEEKTVLTITITQTDFLDNCKGNTANGADCSRYTDCVANPYMDGCDATYYDAERETYTESLLAYCSSDRTGATAPVGAPDCATPAIQADVCASSGTYANPLDADTCPVGYANLEAIQSEFALACYNVRNDLANNPQCENIATCFASDKLGQNEVSDVGGIPCNGAAIFDVKDLVICNGYVDGGTLPQDCQQATIDKACNANPFLEVVSGEGIDCIGDRSRDQARNELCIGAEGVQYDCTLTVSRACESDASSKYCTETVVNNCTTDPFGDTCYDDDSYENTRFTMCDTTPIATEITSATAFADKSALAQNCIDAIDEECIYDEEEQFTNRFCQIGTLYDAARAEACLDDLNANATLCPAVVATYCTANPFDPADDCATGTTYDVARGRECLAGYTDDGSVPTECGDEDTANSYVQAYCATDAGDTNVRDCPTAYATANNTAVTEASFFHFGPTGKNKPLNSDGTGLATVIDAGAGNTANDANANFIVGGQDALVTGLTQTNDGTFRLNELRSDAWMGSGVAVAIAEQKYYVGFLSLTSMGVFLPTANTEITLEWPARLRILRGTTFEAAQDFTLLVELKDQTISVKSGSITASTRQFTINDGKFTHNGLLYGGISFAKSATDNTYDGTAEGSLTGLIGRSGGIAIFKSDVGSASPYVGGFVTHTDVNCSRGGTPFAILCANNAFERTILANNCFPGALKNPLSGPIDPQCNQLIKPGGTIKIAECANNPYRTTDNCNTNPAFNPARGLRGPYCETTSTTFFSECDISDDTHPDRVARINITRGLACAAGLNPGGRYDSATMRVCGSEETAGSYIKDYCGTAAGRADPTLCKKAYSEANPTIALVDASFLGSRLLKSATDTATVIAEGEADTASPVAANFIVGGADALDTGISTQANDGTFKLVDVEPRANANSGFAVAIAEQKYYVGLLSGTDLGRVLPTANEPTILEWSAQLRILRGTTFEDALDFTLRIELKDKTISVKAGSIMADVFAINDGKFTADGLLYGGITIANAGAGTLTGLIGNWGAVGIFKSDVGSESDYVGGFVAAVVDCSKDGIPFHVDCTDNAFERRLLANDCFPGGVKNPFRGTLDARCNQLIKDGGTIKIAECAANPFRTTDDCNINDAFVPARELRGPYCENSSTTFFPLCDILADTHPDHVAKVHIARGLACARGLDLTIYRTAETPSPRVCGSETTENSYIKDYCDSDHSSVATNINLCSKGYARLNGDAAEVSVAAFKASGKNKRLNSDGSGALTFIPHPLLPDQGYYATNFVEIPVGWNSPLNQNTHEPITLADTVSGFAFSISGSTKLYVGLLPGTALGAPLRNATALSATWDATLTVLSYNGTAPAREEKTFKLLVNFGGDTANTLAIMGDAPDFTGPGVFSLDGKFTRNGLIYGTVDFAGANYGAGTITGLIGDAGVVGIFKSDNLNFSRTASRYVGGFVAVPDRVNLADWTGSFASGELNAADDLLPTDTDITTLAEGTTRFLQWTAAQDFAQTGDNLSAGTDILLLNSEVNNGIGFHYSNNRGFAGLLSATNVGAPLDTVAMATWNGTMIGNTNGKAFTDNSFALVVNYTGGSAGNAGTVTSADKTFDASSTMVTFGFTGTFNDAGVINGTVNHVFDVGGANTSQAGVFNGLIGQAGAVGVFKNNTSGTPADDTSYVGGFVVKP